MLQRLIDARHERLTTALDQAQKDWPDLPCIQVQYADTSNNPNITWINTNEPAIIHINWHRWAIPPPEIPRPSLCFPTLPDGTPIWHEPSNFPGDVLLFEHGFDFVIQHEIGHVLHLILGHRLLKVAPLFHNGARAAAWLSQHAWKHCSIPLEIGAELHAISHFWQPERFPDWTTTHQLIATYRKSLTQIQEITA
jgi:hypothetical protein